MLDDKDGDAFKASKDLRSAPHLVCEEESEAGSLGSDPNLFRVAYHGPRLKKATSDDHIPSRTPPLQATEDLILPHSVNQPTSTLQMHFSTPKTTSLLTTALLLLLTSTPTLVLSQQEDPHAGHDHSNVPQGSIIIDHQLNPAASGFKPTDFVNDLFAEYAEGRGASRAVTLDGLVKVYQAMQIIPSGTAAEDEHAGHDHLRRREMVEEGRRSILAARQAANAAPESDGCLLPFDLMTIYGMNTTRGLNRTEFERITPGLVYISSAKLCKSKTFQFNVVPSETFTFERPSAGLVWLYSLVAVTIVTLTCMLGLLIVPLMKRSAVVTDILLSFLIALGAGTLISDAALHLLPSILGLHSHDHDEGAVEGEHAHDLSYLWKLNISLLGLYLFWAAEQGLQYLHGRHTDSTLKAHHHHHHHHKTPVLGHEASVPHLHPPSIASIDSSSGDEESTLPASKKTTTIWEDFKTVKPLAILILLGDSLHNFIDGLAIGASFAYSTRMGLTTSIAVLLHELPHELSDYAILYSSGFSAIRAALLNALSNFTSYIGLIIGILLTTASQNASKNGDGGSFIKSAQETIFALAAGMFIYIAIADLLPTLREVHTVGSLEESEAVDKMEEMEKSEGTVVVESPEKTKKKKKVECKHTIHPFSWKRVVAQHLGLLVGWTIMLLIGLFEDRIKV
ncbi:hypothetical protein HDV05_008799 [Chytridiales sp. JEL 0842]|nr:hypothetical protein HDV05_008799 [Chytridiales sp. JEL 0842]